MNCNGYSCPLSPHAGSSGTDRKIILWYIILAVVGGTLLLQRFSADIQQVETIPYSDFQAYLEQDRIAEILVTEKYIRGVLK